ncbi:MAG: carboxypeptidase-like regulatory domain-containing protein [Bacteroidetes bacterium]|nr:carboxypeptidase-like regulatory domain-containing protein [Bacteroidota bacterium]
MNNKLFFILILMLLGANLFGQERTISGTVSDDIGDLLIGVNVVYGPGLGVITDIDGRYSLKLASGEYDLVISYVGCETQEKHIVVSEKNLYINFVLKTITLQEVEIVGDVAKTRETPIAFSNVTPAKIEEQLASQDIPLILNSTPGVYATASGGGDGDARINIRGFNQRNVAVMLDGIPVNDMENGWVYWSNWFGLDAVMRYTQVQRGLGASKLAIPSVGGTINIATKGIENDKGITLKQEFGNDGFMRTSLGITTGRLPKGWGVTFAGSYKRGDGWVDQTWTKGWFYFLRVDKEIGNHMLSFSAMGAPQEHGQRSYKKYISTFDTKYALEAGMTQEFIDKNETGGLPTNMGLRYNPNWGYLSRAYITPTDTVFPNAEPTSTANNFYHKPMFSLRDFWSVNERLYISNVLYLSLGNGGGQSFSTTPEIDPNTGQQDLQSQYNSNLKIPYNPLHLEKISSNIMRNAVNNHFWLGLLSTFDYAINDEFSLSGGLDLRTYKGEHYREVQDLFGGLYYLDNGNKNEDSTTKKCEGDKIGYYNDALVRWGGIFAQAKYQRGNLTTFLNLTTSVSGYKRIDYFILHDPGETANETPWKYIPGFTLKGGANYNLNESMNVFMNLGFLSKAQRFNNVYDRSNLLFRDIKNEQVRAIELGYSFVKPIFTLNVNTYYTSWLNKPADRAMSTEIDGEFYSVNINDMNARHLGIEFEFAIKILDNLTFESLLSLGDWQWTSADTARVYNDNGEQIDSQPFNAKGLYVGDAAQFQNRESLRWEIVRGLYVTGVFTWFGKHYSEFNPMDYDHDESPGSFDEDGNPIQSWKIPDYYTVDFHAGYSWRIKKVGFQVRGSVINALDNIFITDAQNNDPYLTTHSSTFDANSAGVFMGMGRRFNLSLRLNL